MCPSRRPDLQHQRALRRLVNFLNPPARQDRRDLFDDGSDLCHGQCHSLSISAFSRTGRLMREDLKVREVSPRGYAERVVAIFLGMDISVTVAAILAESLCRCTGRLDEITG